MGDYIESRTRTSLLINQVRSHLFPLVGVSISGSNLLFSNISLRSIHRIRGPVLRGFKRIRGPAVGFEGGGESV